jgi:hypothetical protein
MFMAQIYSVLATEGQYQQWTWMTSFYWAIQTTTTMGKFTALLLTLLDYVVWTVRFCFEQLL